MEKQEIFHVDEKSLMISNQAQPIISTKLELETYHLLHDIKQANIIKRGLT